jgi:hypothetical protein
MNFTEFSKVINEAYEKTEGLPVAIKVNEQWLEKQMQSSFILRKEGENPLYSLTGLPVRIDNSIKNFEFVYNEER